MKIEIIERNYDVGNRLRDLITKKAEKLARYFAEDAAIRIVCTSEGKKFKMEATLTHKDNIYRSETYGENMFENIDVVLPKVERQVVKNASRNKDKYKNLVFENEVLEEIYQKPESNKKEIIKTKSFELDPILLEDAKIAIENIGHDFYAFLNAETGKINILYKRKDGEFGLIECNY